MAPSAHPSIIPTSLHDVMTGHSLSSTAATLNDDDAPTARLALPRRSTSTRMKWPADAREPPATDAAAADDDDNDTAVSDGLAALSEHAVIYELGAAMRARVLGSLDAGNDDAALSAAAVSGKKSSTTTSSPGNGAEEREAAVMPAAAAAAALEPPMTTTTTRGGAAGASAFAQPMRTLATEVGWGTIWTRPGLELKTRSLLCLVMLTALGRWTELATHVRGAVRNGCREEEIQEALLQASVYCGLPSGFEAFRTAERVLEEMKAAEREREREQDK